MLIGNFFYKSKALRSLVLPVLKYLEKDIMIKHHWTGDEILLNLYRHKGYWFHGRNREKLEMFAIKSLIKQGDIVAEVGGHIGYLSLWFLRCCYNAAGRVFVFEPGINNLPYLKENLKNKGAVIIESGCGESNGKLEFYMDDLTGQNNSFVKDFTGLSNNTKMALGVDVKVSMGIVSVIRLDEYFMNIQPNFIKIDTEGFEYSVLRGAEGLLSEGKELPIFMIEVQADEVEIFEFFTSRGYHIFNAHKKQITSPSEMSSNLFVLHPKYHMNKIERWKLNVHA